MTESTEQVKKRIVRNPKGKGGFQDHPELRNAGGRPKNEVSVTFWIREFLKSTEPGHKKERAQELAEKLVLIAYGGDLPAIKEVLDRVEGKAVQRTELSGVGGEPIEISTDLSPDQKDELSRRVAKVYKEMYGKPKVD